MKKHEMVLDFTSLLDVILIILFLVLCTMNGKAEKDAATIDELTEQNKAYAELTQKQEDELNALTTENADISEQLAALQKEQEELQAKYEDVYAQNEENKALAQAAQENLKKFMEIAKLSSGDAALFGLFKEKAIALEIKVSATNPDNPTDCKLMLYHDGKQVGKPLTFYPGNSNTRPWEKLLPSNITTIKTWLKSIFEDLVIEPGYKLVLISITENETGVMDKSSTVLKKALESLEMDRSKAYELYHTETTNNVN